MKLISKYKYIPIIGALALGACNKVLDKQNLNRLTPELVFSDSTLVEMNLQVLYDQNLPAWGGQCTGSSLSGIQSQFTEEGYNTSTNAILEGNVTLGSSEPLDYGNSLSKNNNWGFIRSLNVFIKGVEESKLPDYTKAKFIAQARFWRAFRYWDLVRIYGGVPLVLEPLDGVGDEAKQAALLPRNSTSDCFKQISADLDYAIANLPAKWTQKGDMGKITSVAAAAMKGRALLYYASPQFNPTDLQERWQAAYDANLKAKQLADAAGYGLNASYKNMWFTEAPTFNPEAIMVTMYNTTDGDQQKKNNGYDNSTRPKYLGTGGGSNQPSWEMVKSYPMKDGKMPGDVTSKYSYADQLFYKNRDPRFDATIAYNGCIWSINGNANYRLWTYFEYDSAHKKWVSTEPSGQSNTGFYCRKAISEGTFTNNDPAYSGTDWIEIRYAEILLNLAESAVGINKTGQSDEGYAGLIAVRKRAGIEAGADNLYGLAAGMSRSDLFKAILFERRIEFAYEGKRFWDLRRWKIYESTLNGWQRNKIYIQLNANPGTPGPTAFKNPASPQYRDVTDLDLAYTTYFTVTVNNNPTVKNNVTTIDTKKINWQPTYYFFPIPLSAINNDPNLQQNNNWGGTFDPLQ
jgi:hypothetical protein